MSEEFIHASKEEGTFEIDNTLQVLSNETAAEFARKALALEGLDVTKSDLHKDSFTGEYADRNSLNPKLISMMFQHDAKRRCVDVELKDNQIVCAVTIPK